MLYFLLDCKKPCIQTATNGISCKSDGSFEEKQCHGSTGYCWCVNSETGAEIQGTRKAPGQGEINCGKYTSNISKTKTMLNS